MKVIKRDGRLVDYNKEKIYQAITRAEKECIHKMPEFQIEFLTKNIDLLIKETYANRNVSIEEIQDCVETILIEHGHTEAGSELAKRYICFRYKKALNRQAQEQDREVLELLAGDSEYWNTENSNKNPKRASVQRDYMAGIESKRIAENFLLPADVLEAHKKGIIHFHDIDYFGQNAIHNCDLINLKDMLDNGTMINDVKIDPQNRLSTACTVATQIITAVASSQYGGVSCTLSHLAPYVRKSFNKHYIDGINYILDNTGQGWEVYKKEPMDSRIYKNYSKKVYNYATAMTKKEIKDSIQTFNYQINSMSTTNGQAPFLTVFMYISEDKEYEKETAMLIEEMLNQRILGMKNEQGVYVTPAFPKLIYCLDENNIHEDSEYWYLTQLSAKCSAKRLVPDYISAKVMKKLKGDVYPSMGCRSFLTPDPINHKYYGRFNQGVVTINLPDVALSSNGDFDKFWEIYEERLELCHRALQVRHKRLKGIKSDIAPILWQDGALARLDKGEVIDSLLFDNYSTISLGYAGLYECVKYMTGHSHTDGAEGEVFGLSVMQKLNDKCEEWKAEENISYSVYGSPIESTTYKFAKCLKQRFGEIEGITDRGYITNSYHVPVFEKINAFDKLKIESKFQELSPGGAISYIEVPNMQNNLDAVLEILKYMYDTIMYAELNTKSDYCQACSFDGEMQIDDNMEWYCPNCGNRDHSKMNVARRTCGYVGSNFWNKGRTQEIKERVVHVTLEEFAEE